MPNGRIKKIEKPKLTVKNIRNKLIMFLIEALFSLNNKNKATIKEGKKVISNFVQKARFRNKTEIINHLN